MKPFTTTEMRDLDPDTAVNLATVEASRTGEAQAIVRDGDALSVMPTLDAIGREILETVKAPKREE